MNNMSISTGRVQIMVNNDEARVISFNPNDLHFAKRYYELLASSDEILSDYEKREAELDKDQSTDEFGIPTNMAARFELLTEVCDYMKEQIDFVFGKGTSETVFADECELDMFEQFFNELTPYIQNVRNSKVAKYTAVRKSGVLK